MGLERETVSGEKRIEFVAEKETNNLRLGASSHKRFFEPRGSSQSAKQHKNKNGAKYIWTDCLSQEPNWARRYSQTSL